MVVVDPVPAFVDEPVVARAEEDEVVLVGLAAVGPVLDVVRVKVARVRTARKATASVSGLQRSAEPEWDLPRLPTDVEDFTVPFA
jgi:hypothetical protein